MKSCSILIRCLGFCFVLVIAVPTCVMGEPWTPSDIDLITWYDASDTNTITDTGGVVSQWDNISTSAVPDLINEGTGPATGIRMINALNVLDFEGANSNVMKTAGDFTVKWSGDWSVFMVAAIDDADNTDDALCSVHKEGDQKYFNFHAFDTNFPGELNATGSGVAGSIALTGGPYEGGTNIFNVVFDVTGSNLSCYVDGVNTASAAGYNGNINPRTFRLFRNNPASVGAEGSQFLDGALGEVIVIPDMSTDTRERMEGYLAWKWGLQGNLPPGHPYKHHVPWLGVYGTVITIR